jgi:hypothetical protein
LVLADVHVTNVKEDLGYKQIHGDDHKKTPLFPYGFYNLFQGNV